MSSAKTGSWKQNGGDILHSRVCFKPRSFKVEFRIYNLKETVHVIPKDPPGLWYLHSWIRKLSILYIILYTIYTPLYFALCTLHYTVHCIHSIILYTVYTPLYCTLYTLFILLTRGFLRKKDQLRKPWSDKGLKGTLLVGNVTYVMEGNNKLPLQSF